MYSSFSYLNGGPRRGVTFSLATILLSGSGVAPSSCMAELVIKSSDPLVADSGTEGR